MALAKELQSEGSCGEQLIENECENDDQQEISNVPKSVACSKSEEEKNTAFKKSCVKRTYSIESGEIDTFSPTNSSRASCSIRSLNSNMSVGEGLPRNAGEADTIDETVEEFLLNESLSGIKETKSLDNESSIDTNEDGNFASKAKAAKREQRRKRITEMDQHEEFRRKAMAKRVDRLGADLPTEIELKESTAHSEFALSTSGDDAIASIDNVLLAEDAHHPSHYAVASIPGEINTKKSKKKKKKSSKRKNRKQKGGKNDESDSSGGSWWKLNVRDEVDGSSNTETGRKRHNQSKKFEGSYSLRSIVEDADSEDIKDSCRQVNRAVTPTMTDSELVPCAMNIGESNEEKKVSGYVGMSEMIAEAVAKREARLASKKASKLPFQSPAASKESLASRIRQRQSFPAPLSPSENDDVSLSISDLAESPYVRPERHEKKKSRIGTPKTMNEMIADAAAKRRERVKSGSLSKLPFQSPAVSKESLSSRLQNKSFVSPLPLPISEHEEISDVDETSQHNEISSVDEKPKEADGFNGVDTEDRNHDMTVARLAAEAAVERNERVDENNAKPRSFRKFEPVTLNEEDRIEDKETHRKIFVPVVSEAAAYGRLVRLEEHVVEAQGDVVHHPDDRFNTWTGPKLRTDDGRSDALKAIQEAAAVGRIKCLAPVIVTNGSEDSIDDRFDIENQTDEHGEKISRTNFLVDLHVKEILQGKKERMFIDSDAVGDRDDKIATYKDFDDVKLPTTILPTYDRIVRSRMNESISNGADLAVRAMQLSEANLQEENDDVSPQITLNRLRVIESISSAVAVSASKRDARLQQPRAMLKVTRKCRCPYCKDPNPYQTHKYKRLMYSEKFHDDADQSNFCQEVGETIGTVSDATKADKSSYYISPGGRKKKIIRIVRRRKRRPKGLQPSAPSTGTSDKKCVINGTSLTPEEVGNITRQLQRSNGETKGQAYIADTMTSEEFVLVSNALKDQASTSVDSERNIVSNENVSSDQQDPAHDSSGNKLLEPGERLALPASLPFLDLTGDTSSTPTTSTQEVTLDTTARCPASEEAKLQTGESSSKSRKSKGTKKERAKSPVLPKSPSLRKPRKTVSTQPAVSTSKTSTKEAISNDAKYLSPQGRQKKKNNLRRPKETLQSPLQPDTLNLPAPPSKTGDGKRKKTLRSRLMNFARPSSRHRNDSLSVSDHGSQNEKTKTRKTGRRERRSHSLVTRSKPDDDTDSKDKTSGSNLRAWRRSNSLEARPRSFPTSHNSTLNDIDGEAVTANVVDKSPKKISITQTELERQSHALDAQKRTEPKSKWVPERRSPSRTQSLPIGQKPKSTMDLNQNLEKPQTFRSLPIDEPNSATSIFHLKQDPIGVSPTRSRSFEDPQVTRLAPVASKDQSTALTTLNVPLRQPSPSPYSQKKSLSRRLLKKEIYPEMPPPKRNSVATTPIPPIPSFITLSFDEDKGSRSSGKTQKRRPLGDKLDRERVKPRKCKSLDGQRVSKMYDNSESERKKVKRPKKLRRNSNGRDSRPDPPSSHPSPRRTPKRSRSLDRLSITKLGAQGKDGRKDTSPERKRDRSRGRKNGKSRERKKEKSRERKKEKSRERKKDKSLERSHNTSVERKKGPKSRRWLRV